MMLSHGRGQFHSGGHWTEELITQSVPSRHTIALESVSESALDLVVAARTAVSDLVQSFGLAECPQIAADGTIRRKYWTDMNRVDLECARLGLATTDDTIG